MSVSREDVDIAGYAMLTLEEALQLIKDEAKRAKAAQRHLAKFVDGRKLEYRVMLTSLWANEGEESVVTVGQKPLAELFADAIEEFKRVNTRSDVQAKYSVELVLDDGFTIPIPEEFWQQYRAPK